MLKDTIAAAQRNDEESLLALIEKFKPLLKKYAYKLHYEDSFFDLQLDFIQIVTTLNLEAQTKESEGALVNYICNSVPVSYTHLCNSAFFRFMPCGFGAAKRSAKQHLQTWRAGQYHLISALHPSDPVSYTHLDRYGRNGRAGPDVLDRPRRTAGLLLDAGYQNLRQPDHLRAHVARYGPERGPHHHGREDHRAGRRRGV